MPTSSSATHQPELSWWSQAWRYGLVLIIDAVAWTELSVWQWEHNRLWFWADATLGLLTFALLPWRRRHPVVVATVTNALTVVSASSGGPATLALVSLATNRRWRNIIPVTLLTLAAGLGFITLSPVETNPPAITIPVVALIIAVTVGWGMYIGSRRELLAALRDRAETTETEQHARVSQARTAERARIAREMHDVLAHRISLVTMHAGALVYREDLDADAMRDTARIIQDNSHQAMVDLREVLGILRDGPGDADPELPQPSAKDLPDLIGEARRSGMRVEGKRTIVLGDLPTALGRTVYRVVQEGLTNARKHAADTLVTVNLDGGPGDGLHVEVRNPLRVGEHSSRPPASGLGLVGLSERTALAGGRLSHRVSAGGEFILEAWLPWPA